MRTAYLETVCASLSVATTSCRSGGRGPQMNKVEQISSGHHQMSLAGPQVWCLGGGVSYHVTYPMMHLILPPSLPVDSQTSVKTLRYLSQSKTHLLPVMPEQN